LHALSAVLVFLLARRLMQSGFGTEAEARPRSTASAAAVAALFWAVHPLRVENVAWVTERRDMLSVTFLLLTVLAYLHTSAGGGGRWWGLTLLAYALSLASKAWGITLPLVLVLLDVHPLRRMPGAGAGPRGWWRLILAKWPFLPFAVVTAVLATRAQASAQATLSLADHGLLARSMQALQGLVFYPLKTIWPSGLSPHYLLEKGADPLTPAGLVAAGVVVAVTLAVFALRRRMPALWVGWAAYAILVSPVLGFAQSGMQRVADRYAYLAVIPLCCLVGAGLFVVLQRLGARGRLGLHLACELALILLCVQTRRVIHGWRDSESLWARAVLVEPHNFIAQLNYATALRDAGRLPQALEHSDLSVRAEAGAINAYARFHRGLIHMQLGDFDAAMEDWTRTLALVPGHSPTTEVFSQELARRGRVGEALELLRKALEFRPEDSGLRQQLRSLGG
jgi:hypothetical protein